MNSSHTQGHAQQEEKERKADGEQEHKQAEHTQDSTHRCASPAPAEYPCGWDFSGFKQAYIQRGQNARTAAPSAAASVSGGTTPTTQQMEQALDGQAHTHTCTQKRSTLMENGCGACMRV